VKHVLLAVAWFAVMASSSAIARGGTNSHEMASTHEDDDAPVGSISFTGCGHGRYRDPHTNRCVGPADVAR
jgi:hypothetical protein